MSEWIRIRVKDFYKDAVGELEYTYVTREVYEALADTFRKEAHAQEMRDIRHTTKDGYTEGETEDLVELTGEETGELCLPLENLADAMALRAALELLKEDERQIVLLHASAGLKHREIAASLGMPLATVLSKYNRSIKKLKQNLREE